MAYNHSTLLQLRTQLAVTLGDSDNSFWTASELDAYLNEALRVWAAMALPFRERELLTTVSGQAFYSIPAYLPSLSQEVTAVSIAQMIERHLMEPTTAGAWAGTEEYEISQIEAALENRLNELRAEVGFGYTTTTIVVPVGTERVTLPSTVTEVVRVEWVGLDGNNTPLWKADGLQNFGTNPSWVQETGTPLTYSELDSSPLQLTLAPIPVNSGTLSLVVATSHGALDITGSGTVSIPDDLTPVLKWGALADLLSAQRGEDTLRAQYCERRWKEGLEIARLYPSILLARIGDRPTSITTLYDLDSLKPGWSLTSGTPLYVAMASYDLLALYPVPNVVAGVTMDVVVKAPVLATGGDYIQVPSEMLSVLLDYARHLALFKVGGREFAESIPAYDRLVELASLQNAILRAKAPSFEALRKETRLQESRQPRKKELE